MGSYTDASLKRLFSRAGNHCAFPECAELIVGDDARIAGEICHIKARRPGGKRYDPSQSAAERNAYENLILLCANHHKVVDDQPEAFTVEVLHEMKALAEAAYARPERPSDLIFARALAAKSEQISVHAVNSNVAIGSPGAIQAHVINLRTTRKTTAINAPPDAIGAHGDEARYVEHLISRFNEYASKDPKQTRKFSFAVIRKNIEHQFGVQWKLVPMTRFLEVCAFLQRRISQTTIGKINSAKGIKPFSTFEEFTLRHRR